MIMTTNSKDKRVEAKIEEDICRYLDGRKSDCWYVNITVGAYIRSGTPDILVCYKGRFIALEVKRQVGAYGLRNTQKPTLKHIARTGGYTLVPKSVQDVHELFNRIDRELDATV